MHIAATISRIQVQLSAALKNCLLSLNRTACLLMLALSIVSVILTAGPFSRVLNRWTVANFTSIGIMIVLIQLGCIGRMHRLPEDRWAVLAYSLCLYVSGAIHLASFYLEILKGSGIFS